MKLAAIALSLAFSFPAFANPPTLAERCERANGNGDQIDCYARVVKKCAAAYPTSKYAEFGKASQLTAALEGAKTMCEVGSAFLPPAMSGADQCLLEASKTLATYCEGILKQGEEPLPFAPEIRN